jgi:hypothetical protein
MAVYRLFINLYNVFLYTVLALTAPSASEQEFNGTV